MAELRMIALAVLAIGCRAEAGPAPGGGFTPAASCQPLHDLETAARTAIASDGVTVDTAEAFGERAMGCYVLHLALRGAANDPDRVAETLTQAGLTVTELAKSAGGPMTLAFARSPYHGRMRAQLAVPGAITAVACFWNQREPAACEAACTTLLGSQP